MLSYRKAGMTAESRHLSINQLDNMYVLTLCPRATMRITTTKLRLHGYDKQHAWLGLCSPSHAHPVF